MRRFGTRSIARQSASGRRLYLAPLSTMNRTARDAPEGPVTRPSTYVSPTGSLHASLARKTKASAGGDAGGDGEPAARATRTRVRVATGSGVPGRPRVGGSGGGGGRVRDA